MTETPPSDSEQAFLDRAVVIALGSNLPGGYTSSRELLKAALRALGEHGLKVARASSWWRSKAWPDGSGPDFLNGVVLVDADCSPAEVLSTLKEIERDFGRGGSGRNAPRPLDLDLVAHGRNTLKGADLEIPHPRAAERLFVTGPLAEIAPRWTHPVSEESAVELARHATVGADAEIANLPDLP